MLLLTARSNHCPQTTCSQPASVSPTPLSTSQTRRGAFLRFRLRFLSFLKGPLLPNFNKIFERDLLIAVLQLLEDIFSIGHTDLRFWLSILVLGTNDVSRGMTVF